MMTTSTIEMSSKLSIPRHVLQFEAKPSEDPAACSEVAHGEGERLKSIQFVPESNKGCGKAQVQFKDTAFCVLRASDFARLQKLFPRANMKARITITCDEAVDANGYKVVKTVSVCGGQLALSISRPQPSLQDSHEASQPGKDGVCNAPSPN